MSSMNIDKPLDEMVQANRKKRGGGRGRGGRGGRGGAAKASAVGRQPAPAAAAAVSASNRGRAPVVFPGRGSNTGSKIIVSNLPLDVTEAQVKELFATTIGPLRKISLAYKANGQSSGICHIEFQRADDANRSYAQYNQRLIDGKRPLKVEVIVDPAQQPVAAPVVVAAPVAAQAAAGASRGRGRGRGRGGRRGGSRSGPPREKKTAEDLDAEMEDYSKQNSDAPAA